MKRFYLTLLFTAIIGSSFAQWSTAANGTDIYNSNTGNVGIGLTAPLAFLHILGTTEQLRLAYDVNNYIKFTVSSAGGLSIAPTGTAISTTISGGVILGNPNQNLYLPSTNGAINATAASYQFAGSANTYFRAGIGGIYSTPLATAHNYSNLNVTASPFTLAASVNIPFAANAVINPIGAITLGTGSTVSNTATLYIDGANTQGTNNYVLYSGGASNSLNYFAGMVAINTLTMPAGYQFAVSGNMIATAVTVKALGNWPDYVFKKDYSLPLLSDVKTYIDQNHHLPEVPSEQEIAKDGLNLGEMNKLLMKKVEELTLYLIEQNKELKDEKAKNLAQQKRLDDIEKKLTELEQK
ncbi:hypothetical protein [Mucilaginibacter gotjawali]|uniref:Uncharacterized protein n=2 Tax=Mucilaginibacter gotjawali TaxID=1550579 RepID=A0A0X8X4V4_9SPHI|nr:hypothetical protein [Mucilaginibacter gotjawali]MBB3056450.1 hypothetical protein [Mucilaginibacter gotjawali]BAU55157.1 hypothetical protein MgSA37_03338 [Mucilaginibacter gotjawali]